MAWVKKKTTPKKKQPARGVNKQTTRMNREVIIKTICHLSMNGMLSSVSMETGMSLWDWACKSLSGLASGPAVWCFFFVFFFRKSWNDNVEMRGKLNILLLPAAKTRKKRLFTLFLTGICNEWRKICSAPAPRVCPLNPPSLLLFLHLFKTHWRLCRQAGPLVSVVDDRSPWKWFICLPHWPSLHPWLCVWLWGQTSRVRRSQPASWSRRIIWCDSPGNRSLGKIPYRGGVGLEVVISSHLQAREERAGQNLNDMTVFIYIVYLTSTWRCSHDTRLSRWHGQLNDSILVSEIIKKL